MEDKKKKKATKKVVKMVKKLYGGNKKSKKKAVKSVKKMSEYKNSRDLGTPLAESVMTKALPGKYNHIRKYK